MGKFKDFIEDETNERILRKEKCFFEIKNDDGGHIALYCDSKNGNVNINSTKTTMTINAKEAKELAKSILVLVK